MAAHKEKRCGGAHLIANSGPSINASNIIGTWPHQQVRALGLSTGASNIASTIPRHRCRHYYTHQARAFAHALLQALGPSNGACIIVGKYHTLMIVKNANQIGCLYHILARC